jgi:hypothetical protein
MTWQTMCRDEESRICTEQHGPPYVPSGSPAPRCDDLAQPVFGARLIGPPSSRLDVSRPMAEESRIG